MNRVNIGFIGCGSHSTENLYPCLRYFTDKIELKATCDLKFELAERNAKLFGFKTCYTDFREMLRREDLDAVLIVGHPRDMHYSIGLECLEKGLHILMEKPPSLNSREAEELLKASREVGRFVMVAFMKRFAVGYRLAKQICGSQDFGEVEHISTKFANGPYGAIWGMNPPLAYLIGQAIHHFDLVRYFMGEVSEVYAKLYKLSDEKFSYSIILTFEGGRTGILNLNSLQSWSKIDEYAELTGDEGFIFIDDMASQVRYYPRKDWIEPIAFKAANQGFLWEINHLPSREYQSLYLRGYYGEIEHFIESIVADRCPKPEIEDGVKALRIAEAAWRSLEEKTPIRLI